jgi:hypothetical protein
MISDDTTSALRALRRRRRQLQRRRRQEVPMTKDASADTKLEFGVEVSRMVAKGCGVFGGHRSDADRERDRKRKEQA